MNLDANAISAMCRGSLLSFCCANWAGYKMAPHHVMIAQALMRVESGECNRLMITMPPRHGKALAVDTPIPTPSGWRAMGDLRVGNQVFDERGVPCNVVAVSERWTNRPCYRVITDDGDEIVADESHEWVVRLCRKRPKFKVKTTKQLFDRTSPRSPMIQQQGALELPERELPIPPYTLGVWLGDGTSLDGAVTSSIEDQPFIRAWIEADGLETTSRNPATLFGVLGLKKALRENGLIGNKHIPEMYLFASKAQRLALLQGLIDTDGHVAKDGQVEFCNMNLRLALQVKELVSSLGVKASVIVGRAILGGKDCGEKYRVMFYMANAARLQRKADRCRNGVKQPNRYLSIEYAGVGETVCIQVDSPSHMFLCGRSMLPTHNSMLASEYFPAWYMGRKPRNQIIHASYSQEMVDGFGRKIRNLIKSDTFGLAFPEVKLAEDSQAAARFHTMDGGVYHAVGVGGSATGRGAHLLLIDDPIKGREEAESETQRQKLKDWYSSVAYTRLMPESAIVIIQTRWHEDDLAGWILEEHKHEEWELLELPAINDAGVALWPEAYPLDRLEAIRQTVGPRDWEALYQQRPRAGSGGEFKRHWLQHYGTLSHQAMPKVMLVDPASGKRQNNDYTSIWVVALGSDENYYPVDIVRDRLNLTERAEMVFKLHRKWKPVQVRYERYGMMADVEYLRSEMDRKSYRFAITEVGGATAKEDRIRRLVPLFERGRIWLPATFHYTGTDGVTRDLINDFVEQELLAFPVGKHDDMLDALARISEPTMDLPWPSTQAAPVSRDEMFNASDPSMGY